MALHQLQRAKRIASTIYRHTQDSGEEMHELRRYGQRVWLQKEHIKALALPRDNKSGSINSYCFGVCVLLVSQHANYRALLTSIDGLKKTIQTEHKLELEEEKENEQRRLK